MALPCEQEVQEAIALLDRRSTDRSQIADLTEFLTCEPAVRPADLAFRERLRADLWWVFVAHCLGRPGPNTPTA